MTRSRLARPIFFAAILAKLTAGMVHAEEDVAHAIIVKVNGAPINKEEIRNFIIDYATANNLITPGSDTIDADQAAEIAQEGIRTLIRQHLIKQEAERLEIKTPYDEVEEYIEKYNLPDTKFTRTQTEVDILFDKVLQKVGVVIFEPSPFEIRKIYTEKASVFTIPRMVRARQITVDKISEDTKQFELDKIKQIQEEIQGKAAAFTEVATIRCTTPRARQQGGLMAPPGSDRIENFFPPTVKRYETLYAPEVLAALQTMKPGQMSDIIESKSAFHILYLEDEKPEKKLQFSQVSARVGHFIRKRERAIKQRDWLVDMIKRSNIIWHNDKKVDAEYIMPPVPEFTERDLMGLEGPQQKQPRR